eukprot:768056-Hanusia_phi.AAC.13
MMKRQALTSSTSSSGSTGQRQLGDTSINNQVSLRTSIVTRDSTYDLNLNLVDLPRPTTLITTPALPFLPPSPSSLPSPLRSSTSLPSPPLPCYPTTPPCQPSCR